MFNPVIPSNNPADTNSQAGKLEFLFDKLLSKIEKIAPVEIVSYDRQKNRAVVQILNQSITSEGGKLPRKQLTDIPALMLYGGGFILSFPIKEGDIGWICSADRNISVFKQTLKIFTPATYEKHKYKDSFFIPNFINGFEYSTDDADAVILTSLDGKTKISIKNGLITVTSAKVVINGNLNVNGTINANGEITGAGVPLSTHVHTYTDDGVELDTGLPK